MPYIIVPSDFSDNSFNALKSAVEIAKKTSNKIIILNTYERPVSQSSSFMKIDEKMKDLSNDDLKKLKFRIEEEGLDKECEFVYESQNSSLSKGIKLISNRYEVKLIVMGLTGASGLKEIFVGSNALNVIKSASVPVISIPKNASVKELKKVLFATDYGFDNSKERLNLVINFCKDYGIKITFVYIHNKDFDVDIAKAKSEEFFNRNSEILKDIEYEQLFVEDDNIFSGVNKVYIEENADLLILVKKSHSFIQKLFTLQLTSKVVLDAKLPVLSIHE